MKVLLALIMFACVALAANMTVDAPVKSVTVYSNGYAFVTRSGAVNFPDSSTLHVINFTGSAIAQSITPSISSANVAEFYSYLMKWNESRDVTQRFEFGRLLNDSMGKNISFIAGNDSVSGRLAWFDRDSIGVASGSGISIYPIADVNRLVLPVSQFSEIIQENKSMIEQGLAIGATDGTGAGTLSLAYLASGASWVASYKYYISSEAASGSGTLQGWASVSNNAGEDWNNARLRLVVGNPHIRPVYSPFRYPYNTYAQEAASDYAGSAISAAPKFTPTQVSAYYVYTLSTPATIMGGEERSLPLLNKQVNYKREYYWDTSSEHPEKVFILNNTGTESWASGVASVYLNNEFLGEQSIDYTANGKEARVSVSDLPDISAKKETLNQTSTATGRTRTTYYKVQLTLANGMSENVMLRINDRMYSGDKVELVSSTLPAQVKPGNILEWNAAMAQGGSLEVVYEYKVTNYYLEPY